MHALRYAKEFKPRWLVLENVVHMRPWSRYGEFKESLKDLGYNVREFVLNASDFGVPQSRKRLFVVCDRNDKVTEMIVPASKKRRTVRDILDKPGKWKTTPLYSPKRAKPRWSVRSVGLRKLAWKPAFC